MTAIRGTSLHQGEALQFTFRTSQLPMPITLAPDLAVAISLAAASAFSALRPMMQALAPRRTRARVWALHIVPAPPVTKTTVSSTQGR